MPEALIDSIKNDASLDVLRYSIDAFSALTGYKSDDIFDYSPNLQLIKWWTENKSRVEKDWKQ